MKITFLLTQDLSSPSGLGRYYPWAKELARLGYDVRTVALHPDFANLPEKKFVMDGVTVEYVAQMHVRKSGGAKTYFSPWKLIGIAFKGMVRLALAAIRKPSDVVIIGKPHPMNSLAAFTEKLLHPRTRIILDCDDFEAGSNRFQVSWQKNVVAWFENYVPRKASFVTCNTYYNIHRLEKNGIPPEKLVYLPNGIDPQRFQAPRHDLVEKLRDDLDLNGTKVIAFIGSMSLTNHPVDLLLRAFPIVHQAMPDTRLLLVGTGEDIEHLKYLAQDLGIAPKTIFTGRVSPEQVPLYYAICDVTVDPVNDDEAARGRCPLKLFESWACGVPFVTADVGDRRHLAGDPPALITTIPGDSVRLAEAISQLLEDPLTAEYLKDAGSIKVYTYYWSNIAIQFEEFLQQFISKKDNV